MTSVAEDNQRLRHELRVAIAEREIAQKALGDIALGHVDNPIQYANDAFNRGMSVRGEIEGGGK